ncbi:stability determinant [Salinicola peritrichatus]|uniref:type II toxin-antitoxin system RelB family antitoxin n=1 Tax=Salinicola peritrichatus TaxID=1267424 RepID=UPI000DA17008|nr:stability determinant [Salinicola peritrichatus]
MSTQLDPIVSEFETQEQADSYDRWFRAKVQEALESDKPRLPHDEAMARVDRLIAERKRQHAG